MRSRGRCAADEDVFVMGEDIAEMGGSMGATQGMLGEFGPERAQHPDLGDGARRGRRRRGDPGMRPVVEVMYEDFCRRGAAWSTRRPSTATSGGQVKVPVDGDPGGAGWSPAQHAQQLEAWFVHVPGPKVIFASTPTDARGLPGPRPTTTIPSSSSSTARSTGSRSCPTRSSRSRSARRGPPRGRRRDGRRDRPVVHEALAAAEDAEKEGVSVEVVDPRTSSRSTSRRSSTR